MELDDRVFDMSNSNLQLRILKLSFCNMEKLFHFRLKCSNRHSNQGEKKDLSDKFMSLPHKMKMKRQIVIEINMDLSLMFYLFGSDLDDDFLENEKACTGPSSSKKNNFFM